MIKRTVEISRDPAYLSVQDEQLVIRRNGEQPAGAPRIPCEDIGMLVVDQPACTYSHQALATLLDYGSVLVVCGRNHLPAGLLLPLSNHTQVIWRVKDQVAASQPLRKRLWQQIIQAKIRAQARALHPRMPERPQLLALVTHVRSGDPDNIEARAARIYWWAWLGEAADFRRQPGAEDILNSLLNYGYAVLRAAVARALVAAGLLPCLGIHHANRSDMLCLADDLMEPMRPLVDEIARDLWLGGCKELDRVAKAALLELLSLEVRLGGQTGPLMVALHRTAASLVRCYQRIDKRLAFPEALGPE